MYVSICIFVYVCEWLSVLYIHTIHVCTCEIAFMYMWVCVYLCICVSVHSLYHVSLKESFDYSPAQGSGNVFNNLENTIRLKTCSYFTMPSLQIFVCQCLITRKWNLSTSLLDLRSKSPSLINVQS